MKFESAYVANQNQREIAPKRFESAYVILPVDNIDTDQIIPARFLKTTSKAGLGDQLFYDWRYDARARPRRISR